MTTRPSTITAFDVVYRFGNKRWLESAKRDIEAIPNPDSQKMDDVAKFNSILGELRAYAGRLGSTEKLAEALKRRNE